MRKIYYWADGTWCDADQIDQYGWKSDDFGVAEVPWEESDEMVGRMVDSWVSA